MARKKQFSSNDHTLAAVKLTTQLANPTGGVIFISTTDNHFFQNLKEENPQHLTPK